MRRTALAIVAGLAALAFLPLAVSSYYVDLVSKILIFALFAASLNLLVGYAGLPSLGHAAFFGVAGYAVGLLTVRAHLAAWAALPAALLLAGVTGAIFGLLALRATEGYFLMITLALAQVLWGIAIGWRSVTGGDDGISDVARPALGGAWTLADPAYFYYFTLICVGVAVLLLALIVQSPFGRALRGVRESETRMAALGYDVWRYKYIAFVVAALFAGLAGALFTYFNRFVGPDSLTIGRSADALLMVIVGGVGSFFGPIAGAAVLIGLESSIGTFTQRWVSVLGAIYIVVALFAPSGIGGLLRPLRLSRLRPAVPARNEAQLYDRGTAR